MSENDIINKPIETANIATEKMLEDNAKYEGLQNQIQELNDKYTSDSDMLYRDFRNKAECVSGDDNEYRKVLEQYEKDKRKLEDNHNKSLKKLDKESKTKSKNESPSALAGPSAIANLPTAPEVPQETRSPELFQGMGLENLENKLAGAKCILCNKPLEKEEYQSIGAVMMGPVCRQKALTNNFGEVYGSLNDEETHKKADLLISGNENQVYGEFFNSTMENPEDFLAKVNSLRIAMDPKAEVIKLDREKILKLELKQIQEQAIKSRPAFNVFKSQGLTAEDIKNAYDPEDLGKLLLEKNPSARFNGDSDEFAKLFYEAQDYATRADRIALIKIELSPKAQQEQMANKREKDYQAMFSAGFTQEEILSPRKTAKKIKEDPVLRSKAIKALYNQGFINDEPTDERTKSQKISDHSAHLQMRLKQAFWFAILTAEIGCGVLNAFSSKRQPKYYFKAMRKGPSQYYEQHIRTKSKINKLREQDRKAKSQEESIKAQKQALMEEQKKQQKAQWEFYNERKASDISLVDAEFFLKQSKKAS